MGSRRWDVTASDYDAQVMTPFAPGVDFRLGDDITRVLGARAVRGNPGERRLRERGIGVMRHGGRRLVRPLLAARRRRDRVFTTAVVRGDMRKLAAFRRSVVA